MKRVAGPPIPTSTEFSAQFLSKTGEPDLDPVPLVSSLRRSKRLKIKHEHFEGIEDLEDVVRASTSKSRVYLFDGERGPEATSPAEEGIRKTLEKPHPAPADWRDAYAAIEDMRERTPAPVDTMGCEAQKLKETDPKNKRFIIVIAVMLSSQTTDITMDAAVSKLKMAVGGTLSLDAIIAAKPETINGAINKVGFWRKKTEYIKQAAYDLRDKFDSEVPKTERELLSFVGIGIKMAPLILHYAWDINVGIGVDVHIHRITNRLRWHKPATMKEEDTRLNLESWMPSELHPGINNLLVGFGQTICLPVKPRCDQCTISSRGLCPSAQSTIPGNKGSNTSMSVSRLEKLKT